MVIEKLALKAFGKFKDKEITLSPGLNVIRGDNETGKSTIVGFIKAMLFGFGDKVRGGEGLGRERYIPWGGDSMEGRLFLNLDGRRIVISRKSGSIKSRDSLSVYDAESGETLSLHPEKIIDISEDVFEKTLYIPQLGSRFSGGSEEIVRRLFNLASGGDEEIDLSKAQKLLDKMRVPLLYKNGKGGRLWEIRHELSRLFAEKEAAKRAGEDILSQQFELKRLEEKLTAAREESARQKALKESGEKQFFYNDLNAKETALEKARAELDAATREHENAGKALKTLEVFSESENVEFADVKKDPSGAGRDMPAKQVRVYAGFTAALSLLFAVCAVLSFFRIVFAIFAAAFLVSALLMFLRTRRFGEKIAAETAALKSSRETLARFGCASQEEFLKKRREYLELRGKISVLKSAAQRAEAFFGARLEDCENVRAGIIEKYGILEEIPSAPIIFSEEKAAKTNEDILSLSTAIAETKTRLQNTAVRSEHDISGEIARLKEDESELSARLFAIEAAGAALDAAKESLGRDFAPRLNKAASAYLDKITAGTHEKMFVQNDFSVNLNAGVPRPAALFSGGTLDQVSLALRLGLVDLLFPDFRVPVILDDPFSQYDETRKSAAFALLRDIAQKRQIIFFSCRGENEFANIKCELLT